MSGNKMRWPAAAVAGGLVALAALTAPIGCGREESVASKSAAAFQEAQKRGETFAGEGHSHGGHGAGEPGAPMPQETATGDEHAGHRAGHTGHADGEAGAPAAAGTQHQHDHASMGQTQGARPVDHSAMEHEGGAHTGGHAAMDHGGSTSPGQPGATSGHAGHSSAQATAPELPTQPASILRPDPLDAPAATSVVDAQRAAEMTREMSGGAEGHEGHGGHEAGTYRHIDVGRGPGAGEQHDGHVHGSAEPEGALYVCPMHPEVTSNSPGTCPKCGMTLVERREE